MKLSGYILPVALSTALAFGSTGCMLAGWIAYQFSPLQDKEALYEIADGSRVLVLVNDHLLLADYQPVIRRLTDKLNEQLTDNEVAVGTVPYKSLLMFIARTPEYYGLSPQDVGRALGVQVVLKVNVETFSLKDDPGSPLWKGRFKMAVSVIDVDEGLLWPTDRIDGYPVGPIEPPASDDPSEAFGRGLADDLADMMAVAIAECFYEHPLSAEEQRSKPE